MFLYFLALLTGLSCDMCIQLHVLQLDLVGEDCSGEVRGRLLSTVVHNLAFQPAWGRQLGTVLGDLPEVSVRALEWACLLQRGYAAAAADGPFSANR